MAEYGRYLLEDVSVKSEMYEQIMSSGVGRLEQKKVICIDQIVMILLLHLHRRSLAKT